MINITLSVSSSYVSSVHMAFVSAITHGLFFVKGLQAQERVHHHTDAVVYDKDGLLASGRRTRCSYHCHDEFFVRGKGINYILILKNKNKCYAHN